MDESKLDLHVLLSDEAFRRTRCPKTTTSSRRSPGSFGTIRFTPSSCTSTAAPVNSSKAKRGLFITVESPWRGWVRTERFSIRRVGRIQPFRRERYPPRGKTGVPRRVFRWLCRRSRSSFARYNVSKITSATAGLTRIDFTVVVSSTFPVARSTSVLANENCTPAILRKSE